MIDTTSPTPITVFAIQTVIAKSFGTTVEKLQGRARDSVTKQARHVAAYFSRELTTKTWGDIGLLFDGRDHTTIINSHKVVEEKASTDADYRTRLEILRSRLQERCTHCGAHLARSSHGDV